jgi:thiol-disulfide isomerase/thioredoxin
MEKKIIFALLLLLPFFLAFSSITLNHQKKSRPKPPKIGDVAPEISMLAIDRNTTYKLSDLRGKMVLVNFWASLIAPCRFENPNLVKAYNKYKNRAFSKGDGFAIYSVSLDTDLNSWKGAVAKDRLAWPYHVSDLKGYESQAANDYGVRAIPYNYLIDGEGKVIAINLRGQDLTRTLETLLNK